MDLDRIERVATDVVVRITPWAAPLPTAYLVGRSTVEHLDWPTPVAIVAGTTLECLGLATTATALALWDYNRTKRKNDPSAPTLLAISLVGLYFVAAITLTVMLDTVSELASYAPGLFPILSLTGVSVVAIRHAHRDRLESVRLAKQKAAADRKQAAAERRRATEYLQQMDLELQQQELDRTRAEAEMLELEQALKHIGRAADTLRFYAGNPGALQRVAAEVVGVSERTIRSHLSQLETLGAVERNGSGIAVLVDTEKIWPSEQ